MILTKLCLSNVILLILFVTVGCDGNLIAKPDKESKRVSDVQQTADQGGQVSPENDVPEVAAAGGEVSKLLDRSPLDQIESRDQIIAFAKEIKRLSEAASKSDEERFADYSVYLYRVLEKIGLLNKFCQKDKEELMRKRLDFLIALHQPAVEDKMLPDKKALEKKEIAEAKASAEKEGAKLADNFKIPRSYWHGEVLKRILRQKKPNLYADIKDEELGYFYSDLMHCGIDQSEWEPVDYCPKIAALPLPDGFPDPIVFCADYVESYYRKVIEPKQVFEFLNRELGDSFRTKVTKFAGDDLAVMNPIIGDADKAEKIIALVEKHRPDNANALREWRTKIRRRLLQQVQESAKHQLVLVQRAEEEFRKNDADGNGVKDYWVADVSGLYRIQRSDSDPIRLIDAGIASLDAAPLPKATKGCVDLNDDSPDYAYETFPYKLQVIGRDSSGEEIATDTDGSGRKWFNENQFALCAYPTEYPDRGRNTYLIDESGQLWMNDTQGKPVERRPADYEADGWSKTKITPKYEGRVEVDYGGLKVQQRIMSPRQQLLYEIQRRESLIKNGVIKKTRARPLPDRESPTAQEAEAPANEEGASYRLPINRFDQAFDLSQIGEVISKAAVPKTCKTRSATRKCAEADGTIPDLSESELTS